MKYNQCAVGFLLMFALASVSQASDAVLLLNNHIIHAELAITAEERQQGLMLRETLPSDHGMLFVYDEPQYLSFWMKQTHIPLDLLFFDADGNLLEMIKNLQPCEDKSCQTYSNTQPAQFVLELPAGSVDKLNLGIGDSFKIQPSE